MKHAAQTFAWFANEIAYRASLAAWFELAFTKIKQRIGRAAPAAFVVEARKRYVVANACQLAIAVDDFLRHNEQRNPARARNKFSVRVGNLCQHEMNDVLGDLMLTSGDPHLVAGQTITRPQRIICVVRFSARRDV